MVYKENDIKTTAGIFNHVECSVACPGNEASNTIFPLNWFVFYAQVIVTICFKLS